VSITCLLGRRPWRQIPTAIPQTDRGPRRSTSGKKKKKKKQKKRKNSRLPRIAQRNTAGQATAQQHIAHSAAAPRGRLLPSKISSTQLGASAAAPACGVSFSRTQRHADTSVANQGEHDAEHPAQMNQLLVGRGCRESSTWLRTGALAANAPGSGRSGADPGWNVNVAMPALVGVDAIDEQPAPRRVAQPPVACEVRWITGGVSSKPRSLLGSSPRHAG